MRTFFLISLLIPGMCSIAEAVEPLDEETAREWVEPVEIELTEADLAEIKDVMIRNAPVLASSPGIKHTSAQKQGDEIGAQVLFYPYTESGGVAHAINASCYRAKPDDPWQCPAANLRTYLQLPAQEFQVRVIGNIDYDVAVALVDATGNALREHAISADYTPPDTAVMIVSNSDEVVTVGWGDSEGYLKLNVEARAMDRQNLRDPRSWQVININDGHLRSEAGDHDSMHSSPVDQ